MTPIGTLREELLELLELTGVSVIAYDAMQATEISQALIVSTLDISYQERQLDMCYYRKLTAGLTLVAKTAAELDEIVDGLAAIDNQDTAHLRNATILSVSYGADASEDYKIATATIEVGIADY